MSQPKSSDFLVIGGGIAGLTYALEVADHGSVTVLAKKGIFDSSTAWAQGGIAAVTDHIEDSFEEHISDTLRAGGGLCDREIVEIVVREGPSCVEKLVGRGAKFDRASDGFHLHQEGGHSKRRIFHTADATGGEIQRALISAVKAHPSITVLEGQMAIDLITTWKVLGDFSSPNRVLGAYVLNHAHNSAATGAAAVEVLLAKQVLVATGGAGKVYLYTSNPDVATGDGLAMCFRAGAKVANMEFFQFHPTCLFHPQAKNFLITEALRGEGARLLRKNGERFMSDFDDRLELAPRDVVARAIDYVMKRYGEEYVLLDVSHLSEAFLKEHFPTIHRRCLDFGFDITKEPIPVVPAAHYSCGGVVSDQWGRTDIEGLYVAGECAHTGLHGANRLASNSLLEGLVFATRAAKASRQATSTPIVCPCVPPWNYGNAAPSDEAVTIIQNWDEIRRLMWNYVGIVRSDKRLERALRRVQLIRREIHEYYWSYHLTPDLLELRNLSLVAEIVIRSAISRKESRGLHYSIDHPSEAEHASNTVLDPRKSGMFTSKFWDGTESAENSRL